MNSGKIAAARDKIGSSLDKIVCDNRQNFVKISRCANQVRPCPAISYTPYIISAKGGVALGFDTRTEAIPPPILVARRVGADYAWINFEI